MGIDSNTPLGSPKNLFIELPKKILGKYCNFYRIFMYIQTEKNWSDWIGRVNEKIVLYIESFLVWLIPSNNLKKYCVF